MDRISNLPLPIIEIILCFLPVQEAARTSILSREWRYKWVKIPKLVFDEDTFQVATYGDEQLILEEDEVISHREGMTERCKLFYAIYQVLLKHEGPILEFTLSMDVVDKTCVEIDHIIFHLAKSNTVKKLTLDTWGYKLPLPIFSLHHLTDLHLKDCVIDHPPTFNGFINLTNLYMDSVIISKPTLLRLLSNSLLLKSLTTNIDYGEDIDDDSTITNLFKYLPVVENLSICLDNNKCFVEDGIPQELPTALLHLKYLHIGYMSVIYKDGLSVLLLLIKSSPNLEKLKLSIYEDPTPGADKGSSTLNNKFPDIWLENLNELELKVRYLTNELPEMNLVKFILARSPALRKVEILTLYRVEKDEELQIQRILLSSPCASSVAKIIIENSAIFS